MLNIYNYLLIDFFNKNHIFGYKIANNVFTFKKKHYSLLPLLVKKKIFYSSGLLLKRNNRVAI